MAQKAVPVTTPGTQPCWDGCAAGELRLQRRTDCAQASCYQGWSWAASPG